MRIKRSVQLWPERGSVHLYWRCHNKEFYLNSPNFKSLYMVCLDAALKYKKQYETCKISAFCAMGNHFHQLTTYEAGSGNLSNFMRYAHSLFGARYNRLKSRSGKVAEGRPKTPLIQNEKHEMRVHFYIEANPIRAGFRKIENLKGYIYSSYGFYAYGKKTAFTHLLTIPEWYKQLGRTVRERQWKYKKLFRAYIEKHQKEFASNYLEAFIGDFDWIVERSLYVRNILDANIKTSLRLMSHSDIDTT